MNATYLVSPTMFTNAFKAAAKYNLTYQQLADILSMPKVVLLARAATYRKAGCPLPRLRRSDKS